MVVFPCGRVIGNVLPEALVERVVLVVWLKRIGEVAYEMFQPLMMALQLLLPDEMVQLVVVRVAEGVQAATLQV